MNKKSNTKASALHSYDKKSAKIVLLAAILTLICTVAVFCLPLVSGAVEPGSKGEIDVYLIAGQSNAVGYGYFDEDYYNSIDTRFTEGFSEVLMWRDGEGANKSFVPVKLGMGQNSSRSGAEIGIAHAVADSGRQSAVIKVAVGDTGLYPHLNTNGLKSGTWTPPSYLAAYGLTQDASGKISPTSGSLTGNGQSNALAVSSLNQYKTGTQDYAVGYLYRLFIENVREAVEALKAQGYTPVLKGMWWMQGERETWQSLNANDISSNTSDAAWLLKESDTAMKRVYSELLACFIKDVRAEMSNIFGTEQGSNMPFVFGRIHHNQSLHVDANGNPKVSSTTGVYDFPNQPHYLGAVQAAQDLVANSDTLTVQGTASKPVISLSNVAIVDIMNYENAGRCQQDKWHFNARAQQWFGEQFIAELKKMEEVTVGGVKGRYIAPDRFLASTYNSNKFAIYFEGEFKYAVNKWSSNTGTDSVVECVNVLLENNDGKTVEVYMLNDLTGTYENCNNIGLRAGNVVIDLMGHTLEQTNGAMMFNAQIKHGNNGQGAEAARGNLKFTVKNGAIKLSGASTTLIQFGAYASSGTYACSCSEETLKENNGVCTETSFTPRSMDYEFDNVRISLKAESLYSYRKSGANSGASIGTNPIMRSTVTFKDCVITTTHTNPFMFNYAKPITGDTTKFDIDTKMYGGEISIPAFKNGQKMDRSTMYGLNGGASGDASTDSSAAFLPSDRGCYFALRYPNTYTRADHYGGAVVGPHFAISATGGLAIKWMDTQAADYAANGYSFAQISDNTATNRGTCYLALPQVQTPYGAVHAYMAYMPEYYPILVFHNGEFIGYEDLYTDGNSDGSGSAMDLACYATNASGVGESTILFRQDYTSGITNYQNMSNSRNNVTVDLGGFAITVNGDYALLQLNHKTTSSRNYTVKNGTVNLNNQSLINYSTSGTTSDTTGFNVELRKLNVIVTGSASIIATSDLAATAPKAVMNTNIYDCTFNLSGATSTSTSKITAFDFKDGNGVITQNVNIYGSKIIQPSSGQWTFYENDGSTFQLKFFKSGGKYVQMYYISSTAPIWTINSATGVPAGTGGDAYFYSAGTDTTIVSGTTYYIYNLGTPVSTKYGSVTPEVWNDSSVKYLMFVDTDNDGAADTFLYEEDAEGNVLYNGAVAALNGSDGALYVANQYTADNANKGKAIAILMVRNANEGDYFNNSAYIYCDLVIDLNNKVITQTSGSKALFTVEGKGNHTDYFNKNVSVINGTIVVGENSVLYSSAYGANYNNVNDIIRWNYDFTNVTFKYRAGDYNKSNSMLMKFAEEYPSKVNNVNTDVIDNGKAVIADLTFTGCTFDLTGAPAGNTLFNAYDPKTTANTATGSTGTAGKGVVHSIVKYTVVGGTVYANNADEIGNFAMVGANPLSAEKGGETVTAGVNFVPGEKAFLKVIGNVTAPAGIAVVNEETNEVTTTPFASADGNMMFVKSGTENALPVYTLVSEALTSFSPVSSITVHSQLQYNVYVPISDMLRSFTIDGVSYDVTADADKLAERIVTKGTKEYYLFTVALPAKSAFRDILLTAELEVSGSFVSGNWTMNVVKYAERVAANNNASAEEKALVRDVLNYVLAAYRYFEGVDDDATVAKLNSAISKFTAGSYVASEGDTDVSALTGFGAAFDLGEKISFRLYRPAADTTSEFTFKVLGYNAASTWVADDSNALYNGYWEVSLYAYQMMETIEIYAQDAQVATATYHVSYYIKGTTEGTKLRALVDAMDAYFVSAKNYRDTIVNAAE